MKPVLYTFFRKYTFFDQLFLFFSKSSAILPKTIYPLRGHILIARFARKFERASGARFDRRASRSVMLDRRAARSGIFERRA